MIDEKVLIERLEKEMLQSTEAKAEAIIGMCGASANAYCGEVDAYNKAIKIVKDLASEHNNGWISVEDELPNVTRCRVTVQYDMDFGEVVYDTMDATFS